MGKKRRIVVRFKSRGRRSKSPQNGEDSMNSAREKFKGALQDLLPRSEDDSSSDDDRHLNNSSASLKGKGSGGRNVLGTKRSLTMMERGSGHGGVNEGFRNSFIMKLYDRTVDLSNYTESTPLYPICRAWIANSSLYSMPRKLECDVKEEVKDEESGSDGEGNRSVSQLSVTRLPPPTRHMDLSEKLRVPKPLTYQTLYTHIPQNDSKETVASREDLLAENLSHWSRVRSSWRQASKLNEERYSHSISILTDIFNNAQKTF